MSAYPSSFI